MQLASRSGEPDHEVSPTVSAALVDSLFEASGTVLTGIVFSAFAATLTALKTGQALIWAFVPPAPASRNCPRHSICGGIRPANRP